MMSQEQVVLLYNLSRARGCSRRIWLRKFLIDIVGFSFRSCFLRSQPKNGEIPTLIFVAGCCSFTSHRRGTSLIKPMGSLSHDVFRKMESTANLLWEGSTAKKIFSHSTVTTNGRCPMTQIPPLTIDHLQPPRLFLSSALESKTEKKPTIFSVERHF